MEQLLLQPHDQQSTQPFVKEVIQLKSVEGEMSHTGINPLSALNVDVRAESHKRYNISLLNNDDVGIAENDDRNSDDDDEEDGTFSACGGVGSIPSNTALMPYHEAPTASAKSNLQAIGDGTQHIQVQTSKILQPTAPGIVGTPTKPIGRPSTAFKICDVLNQSVLTVSENQELNATTLLQCSGNDFTSTPPPPTTTTTAINRISAVSMDAVGGNGRSTTAFVMAPPWSPRSQSGMDVPSSPTSANSGCVGDGERSDGRWNRESCPSTGGNDGDYDERFRQMINNNLSYFTANNEVPSMLSRTSSQSTLARSDSDYDFERPLLVIDCSRDELTLPRTIGGFQRASSVATTASTDSGYAADSESESEHESEEPVTLWAAKTHAV